MTIDIWQSLFIGALQGATEFLPVSSDGHLVVIPALLGWPHPSLTYDVTLHMATALAVLLYFRADWVRLMAGGWRGLRRGAPWRDAEGRLLCVIVAANVPAGLAGITFKDWFEAQFSVPRLAAGLLIVNAVILVVAEWVARSRSRSRTEEEANAPLDDVHGVGLARGLAMGVAQIAAILPGISRSGTTIATGLALGVTREAAARFSFLMAAPIIVAAGLLQAVEVLGDPVARGAMEPAGIVAAGCAAAFVVGIGAIGFLLRFVRRSPLHVFAVWCVAVGALGLWLL
ncbi:MAG: undecaprenyl-diphosphate phosphatase [Ardenticatenales bacterium]|jgi:undecaprenyl-diphosphatase|nr:undecaprenyl-diphosphate phosphatase [Ardenticatenales bacterium]